jgi:hypothetical protein
MCYLSKIWWCFSFTIKRIKNKFIDWRNERTIIKYKKILKQDTYKFKSNGFSGEIYVSQDIKEPNQVKIFMNYYHDRVLSSRVKDHTAYIIIKTIEHEQKGDKCENQVTQINFFEYINQVQVIIKK